MFAAVPPLVPVVKLVYTYRQDLLHLVRHLPSLCLAEGRYLIFGIEPDPPVQCSPLPSKMIPYRDKPTFSILLDRTVPCFQLARPSPLLRELSSAMRLKGEGGDEDTGSGDSAASLQDVVCGEV